LYQLFCPGWLSWNNQTFGQVVKTDYITRQPEWKGLKMRRELSTTLCKLANQSNKTGFSSSRLCIFMQCVILIWELLMCFCFSICGTLHSVDQYLNIKLTDISVTDPDKYPHMVSEFLRLVHSYCMYYLLCVPAHSTFLVMFFFRSGTKDTGLPSRRHFSKPIPLCSFKG
jgi:hypothetical protein